jgi:hypothetical protein
VRVTRKAGLAALLVAALSATAASAGVRVELTSAPAPPAKGKAQRYVVWIDGPRLAAQLTRRDGAPPTRRIVFRSAEDVVWLVDSQRQTYYQLDPEAAQQAASQVAGLRQGLESGLESLSPEQRAAVRDLLGELAKPPAGPAPEYRLRERGELGRYAEIACARHDVLEGERAVAELCLADYGKPPLTREKLAVVPALGGFLQRTLEPLLREFPSLRPLAPLSSLARVDGVPLLVRSASEKGESQETVVTSISESPVDAALFELPQGFARSWIPPFR